MRILHVTDHFPPTLGGIEAHVSSLAQRQAARDHEVTVLTCARPASRSIRTSAETTVLHVVPDHEVIRAPSASEVRISSTAYDVVHAHVSVVAPFTAPVAARLARGGLPTVVTVHSMWNGVGPFAGWAAQLSGLASAPVRWTAVSAVAARAVADRLPAGAREQGVAVLGNAVEVTPRRRTPARDAAEPLRVATTMRLARRKRPLAVVRILDRLSALASRPVSLTVVGDGSMRSRMEQAILLRGLSEATRMTGRVPPAEVLRLVAGADVYLAPARLESFGLAALEARSLGLPVVGYAETGLTEFVRDGVEGLLGSSDDDLVECLRRLADEPALLHRMSEHNRSVPSGFTWGRALERHDALYLDLLTGAGPGTGSAELLGVRTAR